MSEFYKTLSSQFTEWVVERQLLHTDFVLLDVGVQGGHHPRWNVFGDYLSVYGFDALGEEVKQLSQSNVNPKFHYFEIALDETDDVRSFFVPTIRWQSSFYRPPETVDTTERDVVERVVQTRSIDSLVADGIIPRPDFIKIDVEGHEPKVIAGAGQLCTDGYVLGVESESGFTAYPHAPVCHFSLISEPLHALGFYLHNIGMVHATKAAMAAGRPRVTPERDLYFTPLGRVQTIDTLFCRDGSLENWAGLPGPELSDRVLKLACILELYNLNDCAIELLQHVAATPELRQSMDFSIDEAIDQLVPPVGRNSFDGDEAEGVLPGLRMDYATYRALSEIRFAQGAQRVSISDGAVMNPADTDSVADHNAETVPSTPAQPSEATSLAFCDGANGADGDRVNIAAYTEPGAAARRHAQARPPLWSGNIVLPDGIMVRRNRKIVGWIDAVRMASGVVMIEGWAADLSANSPVDRIAFFADCRRVPVTADFCERRDVAASLRDEGLLGCGFRVTLPKRCLGDLAGLELRVFAESGNTAAELKYGADYPFFHKSDPTRSARRNADFIARLLRDSERRKQTVQAAGAPRPRHITIGRLDRQQTLDAHVPTHTDPSGKKRIPPAGIPRDGLAVIITFGQSNIANHGNARYDARQLFYNFDFLTGDCFAAADPLLGASGDLGNVATRLGDALLDRGVFRSVVFAPLALGASSVRDWSPEGFAHRRLLVAVQRLRDIGLNPTHFLWHQGESEVSAGTSQAAYENSFRQIVGSLRDHGVYAPIFVAVASRCGNDGSEAVRAAQRHLPEPFHNVFPGPDTDALGNEYRFDGCHFSDRGLSAHAELWCDILERHERR